MPSLGASKNGDLAPEEPGISSRLGSPFDGATGGAVMPPDHAIELAHWNPTHDCRMHQINSSLGPHLDEISIAELEPLYTSAHRA